MNQVSIKDGDVVCIKDGRLLIDGDKSGLPRTLIVTCGFSIITFPKDRRIFVSVDAILAWYEKGLATCGDTMSAREKDCIKSNIITLSKIAENNALPEEE